MLTEVALSWAIPALLFVFALFFFYMYGTWTFSTWKRQGIPGPEPEAFVGNARQLNAMGTFQGLGQWAKQYGPQYGIYFFRTPVLMTSDLDILKEVLIKDFNNFDQRAIRIPLVKGPIARSLITQWGDVWRRQRHTLTPTFTASKLKQMSRFINRCCENLLTAITKHANAGEPLDVKKTFGSYTLDVIAGTGFSFETNSLEEDNNRFLAAVKKIFDIDGVAGLNYRAVPLALMFPALEPLLLKMGFSVSSTKDKEGDFIALTIREVIKERKKNKGKGTMDLTQLMLDSEATEEHVKQHPHDKCLTEEEVIAQGFLLFVAGYETTGTTLQYMSYMLALNPEVQEKLHDEIVAAIGNEAPTYENVSKISYLENCIFETLRLFPPVPMFGRKAVESRTIKGVYIPAGSEVVAPTYTMMKDEQWFPEPHKFNPDRYEEGGCSSHVPTMIKELPFGCGPRQCIGQRLALYEAKMAMAAVVRKIKFVKISQTPEKIEFKNSRLSAPKNPILVGTELRK